VGREAAVPWASVKAGLAGQTASGISPERVAASLGSEVRSAMAQKASSEATPAALEGSGLVKVLRWVWWCCWAALVALQDSVA